MQRCLSKKARFILEASLSLHSSTSYALSFNLVYVYC
jgi:hypothetical protein